MHGLVRMALPSHAICGAQQRKCLVHHVVVPWQRVGEESGTIGEACNAANNAMCDPSTSASPGVVFSNDEEYSRIASAGMAYVISTARPAPRVVREGRAIAPDGSEPPGGRWRGGMGRGVGRRRGAQRGDAEACPRLAAPCKGRGPHGCGRPRL